MQRLTARKDHEYASCMKAVLSVSLVLMIIGIALIRSGDKNENTVNLLTDQGWSHLAGATTTDEGIFVQPLNRVIVHQDGSHGQPNPPVSLRGPHLLVSGDLRITASFLGQGSLRLYSSPPIVYDQWRYESESVDVNVSKDAITVRVWDGSSSSSMDMRTYDVSLSERTTMILEHSKDQIRFIANTHELGAMPDHGLFDNGTIWFGVDAEPESNGWTLTDLNAESLNNGSVKVMSEKPLVIERNNPNSLRNLAEKLPRKLIIGAAISVSTLLTDDEYKTLALTEFSMITPENSMKPQFIHPRRDTYSFEESDSLVDIALQNNMLVHGHTLVYAKSSPTWMSETPEHDREGVMLDHIEQVVSHFRGRVAEWDVVNEPLSEKHSDYENDNRGLDSTIWFEAMGERYIDLAFQAAHKADPSAKLYLNDYGLERDGERWDALLELVQRLKARGVPIDGVGFESHVYKEGDEVDASSLRAHMRSLARLGMEARISEIDVTGDDPKTQTDQYVTALDVCLREPNCTSYTTWGITDKYGSTTRSDRYPLVYGNSLLWDTDMKPKPAYTALQKRLRQTVF